MLLYALFIQPASGRAEYVRCTLVRPAFLDRAPFEARFIYIIFRERSVSKSARVMPFYKDLR